MKKIVLCNAKGGTAKSTTCLGLASGFCQMGKKVLVVDADPQGNTSDTAGIDTLEVKTFLDIFNGACSVRDAIYKTDTGFDLITAGLAMVTADKRYSDFTDVFRIRSMIDEVQEDYDYAIIDTSPFVGMLTISSMIAADYVIIPTTADGYSLMGIRQIQGAIANVRHPNFNPELKILGLLITMYNARTVLSKAMMDVIDDTAAQLNTKVFNTKIRRSQAIQDNQALKKNILSGASNAGSDYMDLCREVLKELEGSI